MTTRIITIFLVLAMALCAENPPRPSGCSSGVCVSEIRWDGLGKVIRGTLENKTAATITAAVVTFQLKFGDSVTGEAKAVLTAPLKPGEKWIFAADVLDRGLYSEMVAVLVAGENEKGETGSMSVNIPFDRIWGPGSYFDRKKWERERR